MGNFFSWSWCTNDNAINEYPLFYGDINYNFKNKYNTSAEPVHNTQTNINNNYICTDQQFLIIQYLNSHKTFQILKLTKFPLKKYAYAMEIEYSGNDEDLKYIKNAYSIKFTEKNKVTDLGMIYLKNISVIDMRYNENITEVGFEYLKNVECLFLNGLYNIYLNNYFDEITYKRSVSVNFIDFSVAYKMLRSTYYNPY